MRVKLLVTAALSILVLSGCATSKFAGDPLYDGGFSDGCATGTARSPGTPDSRPVRDDKLWDISEAYQAGWKSGYRTCVSGGGSNKTSSDRDVGGR